MQFVDELRRERDDLLPIACTLEAGEGRDRLAGWDSVWGRHGRGIEQDAGCVTLRFRDDDGVAAELDHLVESERSCCPFLGWQLAHSDGELVVRITGDDDALASLPIALQPSGRPRA